MNESPSAANRPLVGLALGGGGARGLAHIGVLKVLDQAGIAVDAVAGTSMGGLIGAAYANGFSGRAIEREVMRLKKLKELVQLVDRVPTLRGVFSGHRFEEYLEEIFGEGRSFAELRRPLAVSAVDLNEGREIVFRDGPLVPALRATMSLPGIFAAVERDGRRLVDGGILNNVPADHARALGADLVVAVDVLPAFRRPEAGAERLPPEASAPLELPLATPGMRTFYEAAFISIGALTRANLDRAKPDLIVRPIMSPTITLLIGYTRAEEPIAAGVRAMEAALPALLELIEGRGAAPSV